MSRAVNADVSTIRGATTTTVASGPVHQAFRILHVGFTLLPIVAGLDKFFHFLVDWTAYLAPVATRLLPVDADTFMLAVGVIEIAAGLLVAFAPKAGGYVVAVWLWCIVANLLLAQDFYDIALRDFGLALGALALAVLSREMRGEPRGLS